MTSESHGGVFCKSCHKMVDLASLQKTSPASIRYNTGEPVFDISFKRRNIGNLNWFDITCPFCGAGGAYSYDERRPVEDWKEAVGRLEERMDKIESRFTDPHFHSDIAKALMKLTEERAPKQEAKEEAKSDEKKSGVYQ